MGFGSCLMQAKLASHESQGYRPFTVLSQVLEHNLDAFVFMGDAVYADFPHFYSSGSCSRPPFPTCRIRCFEDGTIGSRAQLDSQYQPLLADPHFSAFIQRVPSVFMWDDHELFDNYRSGMQHPYYAEARGAFLRHLAGRHNPAPYRDGELYFVHSVRGGDVIVELFVFDGRSHRSSEGLLGEQQLLDFETWLRAPSRATWRVVVSSTMFADVASGVGSDNWSLHREEKMRVLDAIYDSGASGILLLSGDAHFVAVVEHRARRAGPAWASAALGCRLVEVCSSPLASVPLQPRLAPRSYTGSHQGFDEEVKFLHSGSNLYATIAFSQKRALVRLWSFAAAKLTGAAAKSLGTETLLAEARVHWSPVCAASKEEAPWAREGQEL